MTISGGRDPIFSPYRPTVFDPGSHGHARRLCLARFCRPFSFRCGIIPCASGVKTKVGLGTSMEKFNFWSCIVGFGECVKRGPGVAGLTCVICFPSDFLSSSQSTPKGPILTGIFSFFQFDFFVFFSNLICI